MLFCIIAKVPFALSGNPDRPGIVHRLDKETSGVMVVAKTEKAHHSLVAQFSQRKPEKFTMLLSRVTRNRTKERFLSPLGVIQRSA